MFLEEEAVVQEEVDEEVVGRWGSWVLKEEEREGVEVG